MEEKIEYNDVSNLIIKEFPDFEIDPLWLDEKELLEYLVASDFARYIINIIDENNIEKIKKCFKFIELLYLNGTKKTKELATIGYLEDIQNMTGGNETVEKYKIINAYLGIETKKWWDKLNEYWNGNMDALKE